MGQAEDLVPQRLAAGPRRCARQVRKRLELKREIRSFGSKLPPDYPVKNEKRTLAQQIPVSHRKLSFRYSWIPKGSHRMHLLSQGCSGQVPGRATLRQTSNHFSKQLSVL